MGEYEEGDCGGSNATPIGWYEGESAVFWEVDCGGRNACPGLCGGGMGWGEGEGLCGGGMGWGEGEVANCVGCGLGLVGGMELVPRTLTASPDSGAESV